jgi:hypothetical protein
LLFGLYLSIKSKHTLFFRYWLPIALVGLFAYFILWFWVFEVHDYYFIEALFFPLTLFAMLLRFQSDILPNWRWRKMLLGFGLIWIFLNTVSFTQVAAGNNNILVEKSSLTSKPIKEIWKWFYFNHQEGLQQIQDQRVAIQQIIAPTDTVFCFSDPYPNVHLSTIDRIGYSGYGYRSYVSNAYMIRRWINRGASKLLLLQADTANPDIKPYLSRCLYHQNKVMIFDLRPFRD